MATEIYFVRHAESLDNVADIPFEEMDINDEGFLDNPVSDLGIRQAEAAAEWFENHVKVDAVFSSGMTRTNMTATPIAEAFSLPLQILPDLREVEVETKTLGKLEVENNISRFLYKIPGGRLARKTLFDIGVAGAFALWSVTDLKGVEPAEDVKARARYCLEILAARPERRIVAVSHNFFIGAMLAELIESNPINMMTSSFPLNNIPNCSVTCVVAHPPRFRVRYAGRKTSDLT